MTSEKKKDASFPNTKSPRLVEHETEGWHQCAGQALRPSREVFPGRTLPGKDGYWEGAPRALDPSSSPSHKH